MQFAAWVSQEASPKCLCILCCEALLIAATTDYTFAGTVMESHRGSSRGRLQVNKCMVQDVGPVPYLEALVSPKEVLSSVKWLQCIPRRLRGLHESHKGNRSIVQAYRNKQKYVHLPLCV